MYARVWCGVLAIPRNICIGTNKSEVVELQTSDHPKCADRKFNSKSKSEKKKR